MKFGKLTDISGVDFSLPALSSRTEALLAGRSPKKPAVYIGCTGWAMKEWVGRYYSPGTTPRDYLRAYGQQFDGIELNSTHYQLPKVELLERWREETPASFRFSPKLGQNISHAADLGINLGLGPSFAERLQSLGSRLGWGFMQLPPHFGPSKLPLLEQFLKQYPQSLFPICIEARQADIFADPLARKDYFDLLQHYKVGTCITDVAGRRDVLHLELTAPVLMLRFVGNGLLPSDYERVDAWIAKVIELQEKGIREFYLFLHEPDNILAPDICQYMAEQLAEKTDWSIKIPEPYQDPQLQLF
ncbi:DUF72 domain-containing protein [Saprospira sp. CCB-QB6]|uniref:DUF72 domain-containing protein n=1 Tax=Saprospira sp. CCB-QB6 TaxID=3023936 RepID=UPI00234A1221|nr:DUF72 domain-containing protein [Saprospira sp. CCB-QB6]WCL80673.1 DUF72 domain-containing protein [Saprospira sp. CCB-QB6]